MIAALDLGSNSFHMIVARVDHGEVSILDRIREMVRLGAGLDSHGKLTDEACERAIECLERFAERLAGIPRGQVRAVGTNTLRKARNRRQFLSRARRVLGHRIDIISGVEEARLVYLGAAHTMPRIDGSRLVLDIGGGSTELIVGHERKIAELESLYMGCVGVSNRFFPNGVVTKKDFGRARLLARQELEPVAERFRGEGWDEAIGTSGTIRATARMLTDKDNPSGTITRSGLADLADRIVDCDSLVDNRPEGLGEQRAPVYPGGLAILTEVFDTLEIESMTAAEGALREGLLYDLLGRLTHEDVRERSARAMQKRFHGDPGQAERVWETALGFLLQVAEPWELNPAMSSRFLKWAADLHEIGLDIAHSHHQRHAAYLIRNADLAGFSTGEQQMLAAIVGNHRRKFHLDFVAEMSDKQRRIVLRLTVLLRLAVLLCRSRQPKPAAGMRLRATADGLCLCFADGWLTDHPLARADLDQECQYLDAMGFRLESC